ncbi:cysteine desulfurase [Leucobacter sp. CSA1]|uniref:Cysteine desulfurase n=1 Tax=Leucobacter chromiisoli TaxID=2796471 RepID=A0A934QBI2_9MICO|nr:cysteine desulfurase family protein [Leucobacter chromiisoli]MBK0420052.1 cysteine desulfurase [Leucobacter chromiisoli]
MTVQEPRTRAYLDHAATCPMPEPVLHDYVEALRAIGNPSSTHGHGQIAREALERSRETIARALGGDPAETILTSGGTESINTALKGIFWSRRKAGIGPVLLIAEGQHSATNEAAEWLESEQGAEVRWLPTDAEGVLQPAVLAAALAEEGAERVALVSIMWANNEVGSVWPVAELCAVAAACGVPVHVDAVAALGQVPVDFAASGAAALSVSAHKIGGPVGIGALMLGRRTEAMSILHGGSQQRSRSGTQNAAAAVAFARALALVTSGRATPDPARVAHLRRLRDRIVAGVRAAVPDAVLRGSDPAGDEDREQPRRIPANAHFTFPGCQGDSLVFLLDAAGISASVGSACGAGVVRTSHVLRSMGIPEEEAAGALRLTVGAGTTDAEVDALLAALPDAVARARAAGLS